MKIKEGFVLRELGGQHIVVALGKASKKFNGIVYLHDTGAFLFCTLKEEKTEECTEVAEESVTKPEEDTVECIDEDDQSLAEYKPQISGQSNPFENDTPTEINDRPVEDYVGEGEDRPGEGKRF